MPRSPSAPSEPYLKCSSSFANTSFSSRKNFAQVKQAPTASRIKTAQTQRIRFAFGERLIGWLLSKCFQIFHDCIFLRRGEHRSVFPPFVPDIRIAFVAIARVHAAPPYLRVEPEVLPWVCRFIFAAPLVIEL